MFEQERKSKSQVWADHWFRLNHPKKSQTIEDQTVTPVKRVRSYNGNLKEKRRESNRNQFILNVVNPQLPLSCQILLYWMCQQGRANVSTDTTF